MRIIGGYARGIRLSAPDGLSLRPTEDRVKETVFSMLGDISGMTVVDLFSGTGAMGLEALSRGAACVKSIELNPLHADFIMQNYNAVAKSMGENLHKGAFELIRGDVSQFASLLSSVAGKINLILADPPYHQPEGVFGGAELVASLAWPKLAAEDCILALEHAARMPFDWFPKSCWKLLQIKNFGKRAVSFAKLISPP
jgi:16S rRNA (guanine966-N2)-methyltransferase